MPQMVLQKKKENEYLKIEVLIATLRVIEIKVIKFKTKKTNKKKKKHEVSKVTCFA